MKLLIIGFDGLDARLCKLLNLSFLKYGQLGIMRSVYQTTVPSWTSIYTGLTAKEHTIGLGRSSGWKDWLYDQITRTRGLPIVHDADDDRELPQLFEREYRSLPFVWNEMEDLKVGLFAMPLIFPPFKVNWCVSGFPCVPIMRHIIYPMEIGIEMGDYPIDILQQMDPKFVVNMKQINPEMHSLFINRDWKSFLIEHVKKRLAALMRLTVKRPVDVLFVGFNFLDHAGHTGLQSRLELEHVYAIANWTIEKLFELCEPSKTFIVSDHGGEMVRAAQVRITKGKTTIEPAWKYTHTDSGVYFIAGDSLNWKTRHECEIKEEILRLLK